MTLRWLAPHWEAGSLNLMPRTKTWKRRAAVAEAEEAPRGGPTDERGGPA